MLERVFHLTENKTTVRRELLGGLTTFMAMAYVPARLASGHVEPQLLAVQLGWLVVLIAVAHTVFAAGERRLQVVGG